jgi:hypothetical protein
VQWYFPDWDALAQDNARIWETYYRSKPLFANTANWEDWMPHYRQLIIEVQEMWEEHYLRMLKQEVKVWNHLFYGTPPALQ